MYTKSQAENLVPAERLSPHVVEDYARLYENDSAVLNELLFKVESVIGKLYWQEKQYWIDGELKKSIAVSKVTHVWQNLRQHVEEVVAFAED